MKKFCKACKILVEKDQCPVCKKNQFVTNWKGRIIIIDKEKSVLAQKISAPANGEYAIKLR